MTTSQDRIAEANEARRQRMGLSSSISVSEKAERVIEATSSQRKIAEAAEARWDKIRGLDMDVKMVAVEDEVANLPPPEDIEKRLRELEVNAEAVLMEPSQDLVNEDSMDGLDPIGRYFGGGSSGYDKQFELANINAAAATFSIKAYHAKAGGLTVSGVNKTSITAGDGMTWAAATASWDATAISAESWVYLVIDKTAGTTSIKVNTSLPDGTSSIENWQLWRIGWDASNSKIDAGNISDLRDAIHVLGFA